jgi:hypothetical protein
MSRFLFLACLALTGCAADHLAAPSTTTIERASSASLAIDERGLYWTDGTREAVMHAPIGGGPAVAIAEAHPSVYAPIALLPDGVVWGDRYAGHVRVMRVPRSGGAATMIAQGDGGPIGIATDGERVLFTRETASFELVEVDLATTRERIVASDLPALGIAVDGADLIVTRCTDGGLVRVPSDGSAPYAIATTYCPIELALDGGSVYFTDYAEPARPGVGGLGIFVVDAMGGAPRRVSRTDGLPFALHRGRVYTASDGAIVRVDPDGARIVITRATNVRGIAVDDELVYWTEGQADGSLDLLCTPHAE